MKISHPFHWISTTSRKGVFIFFILITITVMVGLQILDGHLKTQAAPSGIVSFELAGDISSANKILMSWGQNGMVCAGLSLGLDYLFLIVYAGAIGLGCIMVSQGLPRRYSWFITTGVVLAWAQLGAAILDALENFSLAQLLLGSQKEIWAVLALWCAIPKFCIVALGLLFISVGVFIRLGDKSNNKTIG